PTAATRASPPQWSTPDSRSAARSAPPYSARWPPAQPPATQPLTTQPPTWPPRPQSTATRQHSPGRQRSSPSAHWPRGCYYRAARQHPHPTPPPNPRSPTEATKRDTTIKRTLGVQMPDKQQLLDLIATSNQGVL